MKKLYKSLKLVLLFSCLLSIKAIAQPTYCPQQATSTNDDEIFNVSIGTLTNSSVCGALGGPGSLAFLYQNYTGITAPNLIVGNVYTISVTGGQCSGFAYSGTIYVWIDYNQDGLFTGVGEQIWTAAGTFAVAGTVFTGTITVPFSASFGTTRMRVTLVEGSVGGPCTNFTWGEVEDYNVNIISNTPCTGTPGTNTILPTSYSTCPGLVNPNLTLANQYTVGGIAYQWQSSTVSPVGPFTPIPGSTLYAAPLPTLGVTTWFQVVATCTNSGGTFTSSSSQFYVAGTTTNSVPYLEDFEGIQGPDRLPNCSWWANNLGSTVKTYTAANSNNRVPYSGTRFGGFSLPSANNIVYSNGIQLDPGITYSASVMFATEYFGYNNWSNLSIMLGTSQTPGGLVQIASVSPAISGPYKLLGNTFTVSSSGLYYIALKATAASGSALYLSFDDLSVTIPCTPASGNSPTVTLNASTNTICANDQLNLNATGAGAYLWSNGATAANIVVSPLVNTTYTVVGTNLLTGCSQTLSQLITVNPSPTVFIVANTPAICPGELVHLQGYGALSYAWSNGSVGSLLSISPSASTTYSVIGTNAFGCSATSAQLVTVKTPPSITAISSNLSDICSGEPVTLTGNGGVSYTWYSSSSSVLYSGSPAVVYPNTSTTFTVVGVGANGCTNKATVNQGVQPCLGLVKNTSGVSGIKLYPNPAQAMFTVESASTVNSVEVSDVTGRVVLVLTGSSDKLAVDITSLANGIYYAKINSGNLVEIVKVVKQ
ncbi:MAG: GEVED domain-containing protein [bacterium]|nr:GEVED domain-containing protein [bacterium]